MPFKTSRNKIVACVDRQCVQTNVNCLEYDKWLFFRISKVQNCMIILRNSSAHSSHPHPPSEGGRTFGFLYSDPAPLSEILLVRNNSIGISGDFQVAMILIYTERLAEIHFKNRR